MESIELNRKFGIYMIKRKLGTGGMATVYEAIHSETEEIVALKILHEHYADNPLVRKRLEAEARIVMSLSHPNIVAIKGYGEVEKRPYLVMDYMEGGSLAEFFSKPRQVKHETTLRLLSILADALDYAHSQQVIHRDFKLENILLNKTQPAISDFGIAQSAHTTRITMTGQILGTPQYIAPESLEDTPIDYRADLYSMGIMAYLMLIGYFPFTGNDPITTAIKHRTEHPPTPSLVNTNLPSTLDAVLLKGLAKDPNARYQSAKEFVNALSGAFSQAATSTTIIFIAEKNPVKSTQMNLHQNGLITPDLTANSPYPTKILLPDDPIDKIPLPHEPEFELEKSKSKRSRRPLVAVLMLFACALSAFALVALNGGFDLPINAASEPESSETLEAETTLLAENTETSETEPSDLSATTSGTSTQASTASSSTSPSATNTTRPTNTARPTTNATVTATNTRRPSNTPTTRPSNTPQPIPTDTPRPLPTNTAVPPTNPPPPTNVPPTNPPPPTSVPPTSVPPTQILDPVLDPVRTLVPCIPLVTC